MEYLWAFLIGGFICALGQLLIDFTKLTPARILVTYVCLGVVLTAIGVYDPIVKFAGAGATVPLTGFGYSLAQGVKTAISEQGFLGVVTGPFTAMSAGVTAAILMGLLVAVFSRSKEK